MAAILEQELENGTPQNQRESEDDSNFKNRTLLTRRKWSRPDVIWFLSFTTLLIGCHGYQEQRFALEPQDQNALLGSRVTLPCRVVNKVGLLQWTKDDFGLGLERNLTGYDRYSIIGSSDEGEYTLNIANVELEDDGKYQCQVGEGRNGERYLRSRYAQLTVLLAPDPPRIIQGDIIEAIEDQSIEIECVSNGGKPAAEITWVDGYQQVITDNVNNIIETLEDGYRTKTRSVLQLVPSKEHHNRTITCQAQNTADRAYRMATVNIEVKYTPKLNISVKSGSKYLREGKEARILCDADANPPPQVYRWYINGNPVIGDYNEEMVIFNVTRKLNQALVVCEVLNSVGKSEESLTLEVTYPPSFRTKPENVEATIDSSVTLSCDVEGHPQPEIRWLFHEPGRIGQVKGKAPNVKVLVTNETAGRYICKASIEGYPEIESEATIFIKGTPRILSNRTQFASEGDGARVECEAFSVPKPDDIRWYFEGREISVIQDPDYATLEEYLSDGTVKSSLVIRASQSKHYGVYNCSVTNEFGNANAAIILKPLKSLPLLILMIGVSSGIIIFSAFIVLLVICNRRRRRRQNSKQNNEKPDVTVTTTDMYKGSDRSSNISDLKIQLPTNDGNYELDYSSSDRSDTKVGLPLAGPVRLPNIRHDDHLLNFCYNNDYSDPTYSDPYFKNAYVYDYPQGYAPPPHLRVQSPTHLDVPAPSRSLQGSLTRSIDTTSTLPLSRNASQSNSLHRMNKSVEETDDINRLGLPLERETPPTPIYSQPNSKTAAVDLRFSAVYGNPYLRTSSLGGDQVHSSKSASSSAAPPPYSAVRNSVALTTGNGIKTSQATHV